MNLPSFLKVLVLSGCLMPAAALAQTTLVYDNFNRSGYLNNSTPTVTVNGATWKAFNNGTASTWSTSGTVLTAGLDLQQTAAIDLGANYFTSNPGVYTLSADITIPSGTSTKWIGLGFLQKSVVDTGLGGAMNGTDAGSPWLLLRDNGGVSVFGGPATSNSLIALSAGSFTVGSALNITLVLNTVSTYWTLDAYVGGIQLDLNGTSSGNTYTFTTNPDIQYVGMSIPGGSTGLVSIDNFSLTTVPEPTGLAFVSLAIGLWCLGRRRRCHRPVAC